MLIFPYHRFEISSHRDPLAVSRFLGERTQTRHRWFRWPPPEILFVGHVDPERFRVFPIVSGTNMYAPWIVGTIRPRHGGSVIKGRMTLHPGAVVAVLVFALLPLYWAFSGGRTVQLWWFATIATFHVGMYYMAFLPEMRRAESFIRDITA